MSYVREDSTMVAQEQHSRWRLDADGGKGTG